MDKEQEALIQIFAEERERRHSEEENLRKHLEVSHLVEHLRLSLLFSNSFLFEEVFLFYLLGCFKEESRVAGQGEGIGWNEISKLQDLRTFTLREISHSTDRFSGIQLCKN